jgi:hypothetical protein
MESKDICMLDGEFLNGRYNAPCATVSHKAIVNHSYTQNYKIPIYY